MAMAPPAPRRVAGAALRLPPDAGDSFFAIAGVGDRWSSRVYAREGRCASQGLAQRAGVKTLSNDPATSAAFFFALSGAFLFQEFFLAFWSARELLAQVDSWFAEGFDTLDLKEAKALP